ncbi:hypothetical protein ACRAWF_36585 [Streptomyces sp. L7]
MGKLTSSQLVQRHLAGSACGEDLHQPRLPPSVHPGLAPPAPPTASAPAVAGDDSEAKARVTGLLDTIGYDAVDLGNLADSWRIGPNTPIHVHPYLGDRPEGLNTAEERGRWFLQVAPESPCPAPAYAN